MTALAAMPAIVTSLDDEAAFLESPRSVARATLARLQSSLVELHSPDRRAWIAGEGLGATVALEVALAAPGLSAMIDGWEVLVVEPDMGADALADYAQGRGAGLFRALADAREAPEWLAAAGRVWALWDLAGHVSDPALAQAALTMAREISPPLDAARWPRAWKPLRIAATLARQDVAAGRGAPAGMPRGLALRVLRIALVGR